MWNPPLQLDVEKTEEVRRETSIFRLSATLPEGNLSGKKRITKKPQYD